MLAARDFPAFFEEVHGHRPFPWQQRLLETVAGTGAWPAVLDLPTGSGKTAAIDVAVFHLALEAARGQSRAASVRIAFVVDRRLVVDHGFAHARKLEESLAAPRGPVTAQAAHGLKTLAGDGPPLSVGRLRGGIPREDGWARSPAQPTVLCSTVDQIGSRLLFRGYGVSDSMKPVHAGLLGSDCLLLLDEAHLAEPFRQTLEWVGVYRDRRWREAEAAGPWAVALLTATPGEKLPTSFGLSDEDWAHPVLGKRLSKEKQARLIEQPKDKAGKEDKDPESRDDDLAWRVATIVKEVHAQLKRCAGAPAAPATPAVGVVVNRVARARAVFTALTDRLKEAADCLLLIGPARPVERDALAERLAPIRTGAARELERPLVLVATQCIEAGVDLDLDALITEAAPLDSLRQRFGRLNRAGRDITPEAAILASRVDCAGRADDPVYGTAVQAAWDRLTKAARKLGSERVVEFGIRHFAVEMTAEAVAPRADAPVLLPAHLDLLSQTSPVPTADPDVALYLHGPARQPDSIGVVWRADLDPGGSGDAAARRLLTLVPPRSTEAIELPLWAVRRWLFRSRGRPDHLADIATAAPEEPRGGHSHDGARRVFRWRGDSEQSCWILPAELRAGDTIVVPARYGGVDEFGWNPARSEPATDVARAAAAPYAGRRFAVRVAPGLLGEAVSAEALADALAGAASQSWQDLRAAVAGLNLPEAVRGDLALLDRAKRPASVAVRLDLYGQDAERSRGVVFVAPFGLAGMADVEGGRPSTTEDDVSGSIPGFALSLAQHSCDVEAKAESFAEAAGLPAARVLDLKLAGFLHDAGKADPRFQAWMHFDDPLGPDPDEEAAVLAKSARALPRRARLASALPANWRHEALSVRLAPNVARFGQASDPELVLWLIGVHHGHGRPFFPHRDDADDRPRRLPRVPGLPRDLPPGPGPQALAFDWQGRDWPQLFERLKARYGVWELARMEAVLRLADHRASEDRARETDP